MRLDHLQTQQQTPYLIVVCILIHTLGEHKINNQTLYKDSVIKIRPLRKGDTII